MVMFLMMGKFILWYGDEMNKSCCCHGQLYWEWLIVDRPLESVQMTNASMARCGIGMWPLAN
jgi:hypothetical protein